MRHDSNINDFGLLIAFVLPGFTALWGTTFVSSAFRPWFGLTASEEPTLGGFLFLTLASVGAGLAVSTLRWLLIDALHHRTGVPPPSWHFREMAAAEAGYRFLVEQHYRYYQNAANMVVALAVVLVCRLAAGITPGGTDALLLACGALFFAGSRDALRKYYRRGEQLLGGAAVAGRTPPASRRSGPR